MIKDWLDVVMLAGVLACLVGAGATYAASQAQQWCEPGLVEAATRWLP